MNFKVNNVNCINCVNLIKNSLQDEYGLIDIDLENKILSIDLKEEQLENFEHDFKELGFEIVERI
ncbi:heavy metal transport/detoxification protein [Campylobacter estrildidarum]|uniref:Heavy metal transport/detoxification protein n=1 Tax=Campylobacter estrildidarum TaxID=2510189 RepID=A0A4U7BSP0_9BACT|nr:heavy metal transport/detoxification protein [Campylobacter estrildidarum]TKX32086.1 heavy metal transport/detoxification protein [Campylobacter estrildidarum]